MGQPFPSFIRKRIPGSRRLLRWIALLVGITLYCLAHIEIGMQMAAQTNHDAARSDQANNIKCSRVAAERAEMKTEKGMTQNIKGWMPHYTDGVVNPLWPRIAASFGNSEDDQELFEYGKRWNVVFTAIFLGLVALVLGFRWSVPAVFIFLLAAGMGAFLPRAPWFQPEPLYFALFFLSWATGAALLRSNAIWLYALFGLWTGLAYLAKSSVLPLILVFIGVTIFRFIGAICPKFKSSENHQPRSSWNASNHFIGMAVFLGVHLMVISPRLTYSHEVFGSPTHSFPTYWMWMDDFEEGYAWMGNHNTREKLMAVTAVDKPSLKNYLASHNMNTAWQRLVDGTWWQVRRLAASSVTPRDKNGNPRKPWESILERPGWTLAALCGLAVLATAYAVSLRRKEKLPVHCQEPERGIIMLYVIGCFAFYSMLHGWYTPVGDGDRFMMALFAPMVFSLIAAGESIMRRLEARESAPVFPATFRFGQWLVVVWLAWRMLEVYRYPNFS